MEKNHRLNRLNGFNRFFFCSLPTIKAEKNTPALAGVFFFAYLCAAIFPFDF